MTTRDQTNVYPDSWMQIEALMPRPRQTTSKMKPKSKRNNKSRSVATRTMVKTAITTLMRNPRAGVSFMAIRRYIEENYFKDSNKGFYFVKRYIRESLEKGELIRTKGNGISGSFRLPHTKGMLKKPTKKKKANVNKRKRKVKNINDIRNKVKKQMKEMILNGKLNKGALNAEKIVGTPTSNTVDPMKATSRVASKLNIT